MISGKHGKIETDTVARALARFYDLGVRPDWWKLEPAADAATWKAITETIANRDTHCRGVVILGLEASEDELLKSFEVAAAFDLVKGFAVGRTIFADVAEAWLSDKLDDETARNRMAGRFKTLADGWMRLRGL